MLHIVAYRVSLDMMGLHNVVAICLLHSKTETVIDDMSATRYAQLQLRYVITRFK